MTRAPCVLAALAAVLLSGCLEREETIEVLPGGGLEVSLVLTGDAGDFDPRGDALPTGGPWAVTDEEVKDGDRTKHVRKARASFASAAAMPASFGDDAQSLRAPTTLAVEALPGGGTRWVLERRYPARTWAWRAKLEREAFPDELKKALERRPEDGPLPDDLLLRAVTALLRLKRGEALEQVEAALVAVAGRPVDAKARLAARAAFAKAHDAAWSPAALLPAVKEGAPALAKLDAAWRDATARDAAAAIVAALGDATPDAAKRAFLAARRELEVTEDLRDETFVTRVRFPGKVVTTDGEVQADGRTVVFRWKGEDLCDREHVLRAVAADGP